MNFSFKSPSVIPGFVPTFAFSLLYLSLIVLIPLSALILKSATIGWKEFWLLISDPRTIAALKISMVTSVIAAGVNVVFGVIAAWVLIRYRFPGRRFIDAIVDVPFALPTAVAGISLAALYSPNGWLGSWLNSFGLKVAFTPIGITIALILVGLPFVIRTLQPVLQELDLEVEEASATLGASRWQTLLYVVLPTLVPSILTGFSLALARGIGEYGSVIFIAGNIPYVSEIAPLLIIIRLEEYNIPSATAVAAVMLVISFFILFLINLTQAWAHRRFGNA